MKRKLKKIEKRKRETAKCPVCGMEININECLFSTRHYDRVYYFCTDSCLKTFRKNPENYVSSRWTTDLGEDII